MFNCNFISTGLKKSPSSLVINKCINYLHTMVAHQRAEEEPENAQPAPATDVLNAVVYYCHKISIEHFMAELIKL